MWRNWKLSEEDWLKVEYSLQDIANSHVTAIIWESAMLPEHIEKKGENGVTGKLCCYLNTLGNFCVTLIYWETVVLPLVSIKQSINSYNC